MVAVVVWEYIHGYNGDGWIRTERATKLCVAGSDDGGN